jgi:hypothetical protein
LSVLLVGAAGAWYLPGTSGATSLTSGHEFDYPVGLAFSGGHLWVANEDGNSVSEINPANGSWLASLTSGPYGIEHPTGIASYGSDIFVANSAGSVSEVSASSRQLVRIVFGTQYRFKNPVAITEAGGRVLVLNAGTSTGSITEFNAHNGALIRVISGSQYDFRGSSALAIYGLDAFVANKTTDAVTEVNMNSGRLVRVVSEQGLSGPDGIAVDDGRVWVSDSTTNSATEIIASNGTIVGTFTDSEADYGFGDPATVIAAGSDVYIATPYGSSPMVTRVDATTGTPYWYMCNTNGPYYFSQLSAFAVSGDNLWVASRSGANSLTPGAATGSLTEMNLVSGALVATFPTPPTSSTTTTSTSTTTTTTTP